MPRIKNNQISYKRKRFAQEYVKTKSPVQAAEQTHNCKNKNSAAVLGHTLLKRDDVQREIERALEGQNITDEEIAKGLKDGLNANVVSDYKGDTVETSIPDHKVRHKYIETVSDIKGLKAPQKTENVNLDLKVESMSIEEILMELQQHMAALQQDK